MKLAGSPKDGTSSVESLMEYSYGEQVLDSLSDPKVQLRIAAKRAALDLRYAQAAQHESRGKNARRSRPPAEQSGRECDARVDRPSASIRPVISSSSGSTLPHIATGRDSSRTDSVDATLSVKTAARHAGLAELPCPTSTSQTPARFGAVSIPSSAPASTVASPIRLTEPRIPARRPSSAILTPLSARLVRSDTETRASGHIGSVPALTAAQPRLLPHSRNAAGGTATESWSHVESPARGGFSFNRTLRSLWTKLDRSHTAFSD